MEIEAAVVDTVIESALVVEVDGEEESATLTVKLEVPVAEGVPEITPAELRLSPAGSVPEDTDQL